MKIKDKSVYLDLSDPKVYAKLSKSQKKYVLAQERIYKEKVRLEGYYENLQSDIERKNAINRQQYILSGQAYKDAQKIFFENYSRGLKSRGEAGLANILDFLVGNHKSVRWRDALYSDLPELTLFYADKRSQTGRDLKDIQVVGDNPATYEDIKFQLELYAKSAKVPQYVIEFLMNEDFSEDSAKNYTLDELRYLAKDYK